MNQTIYKMIYLELYIDRSIIIHSSIYHLYPSHLSIYLSMVLQVHLVCIASMPPLWYHRLIHTAIEVIDHCDHSDYHQQHYYLPVSFTIEIKITTTAITITTTTTIIIINQSINPFFNVFNQTIWL